MLRRIPTAFTPDSATVVCYPCDRRGRLLASSMLCGGTLRGLAAAAGMMTALGISPAFASCYSTATALGGDCTAVVPVGGSANTAYGNNANAAGSFATATGANSLALGESVTATGANSVANGINATATGGNASATGDAATATPHQVERPY